MKCEKGVQENTETHSSETQARDFHQGAQGAYFPHIEVDSELVATGAKACFPVTIS